MDEQLSLDGGPPATLLLMSLRPAFMAEIRAGEKQFEYRRKYRRGPTRVFIYENAPVSAVTAMIDFGAPTIATPEEIAEMADALRPGHGEAILEYMSGLEQGFVVPIEGWREVGPIGIEELRAAHPRFAPPQSYMLLASAPALRELLLASVDGA